jgi:hypothetical protein
MNGAIQFVGVVWLSAAAAVCSQQKPKDPPPPKPPAVTAKPAAPPPARPVPANRPPAGGVPKGQPQVRLPNPDNPIDRLLRMSPEQRERAIEKFPAKQQENFRRQFENFDKLTDAQKQARMGKLDQFWNLPPDKQNLVRAQVNALTALPKDRSAEVSAAYVRLSRVTPEERNALLLNAQFRSRFTAQELQILSVLPEYFPWR